MRSTINNYLNYLSASKNLSDSTIDNYRRDLDQFASFLEMRDPPMKSPGDLSKEAVRDYYQWMLCEIRPRSRKATQ